jgi:anti-anti-sigma factor
MKFSVEQDDELVIFTIKEATLDAQNAPEVKSELLILCQPNVRALVIDLTPVLFCDSQGLSALLLAHRQLRETEGFVILVGVNETVRNLLRISQIEYLFEFFDTVQDAVAFLSEDRT